MKKIKVELSDNAPYKHTYLLEHDTYTESRNVYLVEQRAFDAIIQAKMPSHMVPKYEGWDLLFQQKMTEKYSPTSEGRTPLMPRMTVHKFVERHSQSLKDKLFGKKKEQTIFQVDFGNGRHRFNLFRYLGAKYVPFQMSRESADNLNEMFGDIVCTIVR